ncbi:MAG: TRAP transporter small permease [Proteobacteria bacterium]|nr:TRAP transporter small permease [Pseudomonadota bacterium]
MERLSDLYGRLLAALAYCACAVLFAMMMMICADVLLRNVALIPGVQGLPWSNELTENMLYLITMFSAPYLLRQGQHIRVDILLRMLPRHVAWYFEWVTDALAFACCIALALYGTRATLASLESGALTIKTLVTPEWWFLAPLPVAFLLLAVEILFRMRRLWLGERAPRDDAVSAS